MTDVLILYEHRSREIDNAVLLLIELKKRGLNVKIANIYSQEKYFIIPKIIIVPHLYNDEQVRQFLLNFKNKIGVVIDLQYEQVLNKSSEDSIHNPKGIAQKAYHIAWGMAQKERYLRHDIPERNIFVSGCISMDFLSPKFNDFFFSKEEISRNYGLDVSKEWVLFISSFSYANIDRDRLTRLKKMSKNAAAYSDISTKSFDIIIRWFSQACLENPDKIFIYRKHPAEETNVLLDSLERKFPNFRCINDFQVNQWIKICDRIYTWYSTSIINAYYAHKMCYILRPCKIPEYLEVDIMDGAEFITSFDDFVQTLNSKNNNFTFPISNKKIEFYYGENHDFAYIKIADFCNRIISSCEQGDIKVNHKRSLRIFCASMIDALFFKINKLIKIKYISAFSGYPILNRIPLYQEEGFLINKDMKDRIKRLAKIVKKQ